MGKLGDTVGGVGADFVAVLADGVYDAVGALGGKLYFRHIRKRRVCRLLLLLRKLGYRGVRRVYLLVYDAHSFRSRDVCRVDSRAVVALHISARCKSGSALVGRIFQRFFCFCLLLVQLDKAFLRRLCLSLPVIACDHLFDSRAVLVQVPRSAVYCKPQFGHSFVERLHYAFHLGLLRRGKRSLRVQLFEPIDHADIRRAAFLRAVHVLVKLLRRFGYRLSRFVRRAHKPLRIRAEVGEGVVRFVDFFRNAVNDTCKHLSASRCRSYRYTAARHAVFQRCARL